MTRHRNVVTNFFSVLINKFQQSGSIITSLTT